MSPVIDLGHLLDRPSVSRREVEQLANSWINEPGMTKVAIRIAHLCRVPPGEPFNNLRSELAVLAAEQYLQGRLTGRARVNTLPELPRIQQK